MQLFVPYLYVPSAHATYVKLVTPLGELHIDRSVAWQAVATLSVLVVTLVLYKLCFRQKTKQHKKKTKHQRDANDRSGGNGDSDDDSSASDDDGRSALDESILKKGENSYYYAHQRRVVKADGEDSSDAVKKTMVSTYGWVDNKDTVNIYLRDDAVAGMQDEQLILNWTKTSFSLDLLTAPGGDQAKSLVIPTLYSDIKDVTWTVKRNQLTLTLTKAKSSPWVSLNGAAKNLQDHIEYDESLFD